MTHEVADAGDGHGLDSGAARAVALAESEAFQLGHDRVGTEHLLLGLLTNDSATSSMLSDAGVTLAAARNKVSEAVGASSRVSPDRRGPLPKTARATRALARSVRFAHARGSDVVTSDHVLTGVLDVEGIAGQVLRGLGLDVEALRAALDALVEPSPPDRDAAPRPPGHRVFRPATCPSCDALLDDDLVYRVAPARDEHGHTRNALIFACGACGRVLGVGPA